MGALRKMNRILEIVEDRFLIISFVFTIILVFMQVVMRYVFNSSLAWSEELARYIFIWQIWIGASYAIKSKSHIRVKLFNAKMSERTRYYTEILVTLIWLAICVFMLVNGWKLTDVLLNHNQLSSVLRIPMGYIYMAIPVSAAFMIFRMCVQLAEASIERRRLD